MYLLIDNKRYTELNKQGKEIEIEFKSLIKQNNDLVATTKDNRKFTIGNANWDNLTIEGGELQTKVTKEEKLLLVNQQLSKQVNDLLIENKQNKQINKMLVQQINDINIKLNNRGDL